MTGPKVGIGFLNHDIRYLLTKCTTVPTDDEWTRDARWLAFVVRKFGQPTLTEALRRVHGGSASRGYLYGVCRKIAQG